jgi:hypothetical protein
MNATVNDRAKRAAEFSPAWSEAEPRVPASIKSKARFSGRQTDSLDILGRPLKRARPLTLLMYPGLRFACPGLSSAAGCAGSLSHFVFNSAFQAGLPIILGLIPEGGY